MSHLPAAMPVLAPAMPAAHGPHRSRRPRRSASALAHGLFHGTGPTSVPGNPPVRDPWRPSLRRPRAWKERGGVHSAPRESFTALTFSRALSHRCITRMCVRTRGRRGALRGARGDAGARGAGPAAALHGPLPQVHAGTRGGGVARET